VEFNDLPDPDHDVESSAYEPDEYAREYYGQSEAEFEYFHKNQKINSHSSAGEEDVDPDVRVDLSSRRIPRPSTVRVEGFHRPPVTGVTPSKLKGPSVPAGIATDTRFTPGKKNKAFSDQYSEFKKDEIIFKKSAHDDEMKYKEQDLELRKQVAAEDLQFRKDESILAREEAAKSRDHTRQTAREQQIAGVITSLASNGLSVEQTRGYLDLHAEYR